MLFSSSLFSETELVGVLVLVLLLEWSPVSHQFPGTDLIGLLVLFVDSITTFQRSRASSPSIRSPASNEMIPDSVQLWDTDVCFLHIQLMGTNVRLPKYIVLTPKLILNPQGRQQSLSLGINPVDNAEPCYPHDNIVGSHLCDELCEINLAKRLSQA